MADDDASQAGLGAEIVIVPLQDDDVVGVPPRDAVRANANRRRLEEGVGQIGLPIYGLRVLQAGSLAENHGDAVVGEGGGQQQRGRVRLRQLQNQRRGVGSLDLIGDLVFVEAPLSQVRAGEIPQQHGPLKRPRGILSGRRRAIREFEVGPQLEGQRQPVGRTGPAFRGPRKDLGRILRIVLHKRGADIAHNDVGPVHLADLGRIESDQRIQNSTP